MIRARQSLLAAALLALISAPAQGAARADGVPVLGVARPAWFADLLHELEAAGFDPRVDGPPDDHRWALRVAAAPDRIDVLSRDGADWTVDERLSLGPNAPARRRAIIRAVEILRARRAWTSAAELAPSPVLAPAAPLVVAAASPATGPSATGPSRPVVPAVKPPVAPSVAPPLVLADARPVVHAAPVAEVARPVAPVAPPRLSRVSVGLTSSVGGAGGGLGAVAALGLAARWTGRPLGLWARAEAAPHATTLSGAEGSAEIRTATLALGAAWWLRDPRGSTVAPFLGGEASGHLLRAVGQGGAGYHGQSVVVPGLSLGPVGGASFAVTPAVAVVAQLRAGLVLWEPAVSFAGRHVAGLRGASLLGTVELSWRF